MYGFEPGKDIRAEAHAQCAAVTIDEHLEVSTRLRRLDDAERELPARHLQIRSCS